jgi:predicted AAA+ superfamily ATPase
LYPRYLEPRLRRALADTRVVMIAGPRQSGKTTLARQMARTDMAFMTLDNVTTLAAARSDPVSFVRSLDRAVVDEVQRVPELLLAIKESVDSDRRPGRFLLTGSANVMTLPRVADSLAGRMTVVSLLPLAQSELHSRRSAFLDRIVEGKPPRIGDTLVGADLVGAVLAGGFPEALTRANWSRRHEWHADYVDALVKRDIRDVAQLDQLRQVPRLLRVLAQHAGQLANYSAIGAAIGMNHVTTQKYIGVLESMFLIASLRPWHTNELKRVVKTPKLHFVDSGLLASQLRMRPETLRDDRSAFGPVLETFVFAELAKLLSWRDEPLELLHFRDRERHEVDFVLETAQGRIIGIEVKAAATVTAADFNGLKRLASAAGRRFVLGLVLHDHHALVPFGERLYAAPIASLWA